MERLAFDWDPDKARHNKGKHGVSFEEAETVFYDENARLIYDPDHSKNEDRFLLLGLSMRMRLIVVSHTFVLRKRSFVSSQRVKRQSRNSAIMLPTSGNTMRDEYDFSDSTPNPYAKSLKKSITIRLGIDVIAYFKGLAEETGLPYQHLINLYLRDCVATGRTLKMEWQSEEDET